MCINTQTLSMYIFIQININIQPPTHPNSMQVDLTVFEANIAGLLAFSLLTLIYIFVPWHFVSHNSL